MRYDSQTIGNSQGVRQGDIEPDKESQGALRKKQKPRQQEERRI